MILTSARSGSVDIGSVDILTAASDLRKCPFRIGVSTRALFDLEDEHAVFERDGLAAYAALLRVGR